MHNFTLYFLQMFLKNTPNSQFLKPEIPKRDSATLRAKPMTKPLLMHRVSRVKQYSPSPLQMSDALAVDILGKICFRKSSHVFAAAAFSNDEIVLNTNLYHCCFIYLRQVRNYKYLTWQR